MRFSLTDHHVRLLRQAAVISILAGIGAGCSSDYTRNNWSLYTQSVKAEQSQNVTSNPYPDNLDPTTTSSVGQAGQRAPVPAQDVDPRPLAPDGAEYGLTPPNAAEGGYSPYESTRQIGQSKVTRAELPPASQSSYSDPGRDSVRQPDPGGNGWSSAGGTTISMREGETLYNLSKRYGVPVSAIMEANGIADASQVQAGQRIVIPTYVYSRNAPVSAPDNNPGTRFASAARGSIVEPAPGAVPAPQWRPRGYSVARGAAQQPVLQAAVASSGPGMHVVASGETLSSVARANNVTVSELMAANGLAGHALRVGQRLKLPNGATSTQMASTDIGPVDPVVTASPEQQRAVAGQQDTKAESQTAALSGDAPAQTGIGQFRWPVRGRVISSFGEKTRTGRNDGIDISVPEGTAVKAAENGVVVYAGDELEGFGNLLLVRHSDGWVSAYAHNKALEVKRGDEVRRGQIIARSGRTGNADMPKLHFELRKSSAPVDPLKHLGGA